MDPGFRLDGRYRMERRIGRRGPAQVWCARDELLGRRVAVTLVAVRRSQRTLRRRLRDSARAAAALAHPAIVTTYDYGETDQGEAGRGAADGSGEDALIYVVTEFLSGESLAARLRRGPPRPQEAAAVCAQVAEALAAVHACGVVHGDLRPAQVFLTADGVKLLGLGVTGIAGDARDEGAAGQETGDGAGDGEAGRAGDVLAFGALLAACLPDAPPPPGPADAAPPAAAPPDGAAPGGLAAELAALAARCRAPEPGDRPSAAEAARALEEHAAETVVLPPPAAPGGRRGRREDGARRGFRRVRRAAVLGGAAAAVLALLLAPLVVIMSSLRDSPGGLALPAPPRRSAPPPAAMDDLGARRPAPAAPSRPARTARPAAPADARAVAVSALSRMRRSIDVGIAVGEVRPGFGSELATQVTTLLNEVDAGEPVDLASRVARLRAAMAGRAPHDVSPERAAGLSALLAEIPVRP